MHKQPKLMREVKQAKEQQQPPTIIGYVKKLRWHIDQEFLQGEGFPLKEKLDAFYRGEYNYASFFPIKYKRLASTGIVLHGIALVYWLWHTKYKTKPNIIIYHESEDENDVIKRWSSIKNFIEEGLVEGTPEEIIFV
jgi:hypothetical protein